MWILSTSVTLLFIHLHHDCSRSLNHPIWHTSTRIEIAACANQTTCSPRMSWRRPAVTHIDIYTLFPKYIHNERSRLGCLFCVGMLFADFSVASVMTHCSLTNLLALSQRDRALIWKLPWLIIWCRRLFLALQSKHSLDVICSNTPFCKLSVGYVWTSLNWPDPVPLW